MDLLWAPWRMDYILASKGDGCFICAASEKPEEEESLLLHIGDTVVILLNRYPYNPGHVMVAPKRHVATLDGLGKEEQREVMEKITLSVRVLGEEMGSQGYNVGINLGKAAGAGLEDHLHVHVVPRWEGDTNFMPLLAEVKVVPEHLIQTYKKLKDAFCRIGGGDDGNI
jgi:ATP adenylyltransferase